MIKENPHITNKELAEACGLTEDGVYWNTKKLKKSNIIRRVGGDKGGHEQDVKAMLELYDHPEELTFPDEGVSEYVSGNGEDVRNNVGLSEKISEKQDIMLRLSEKMSEKMSERLSEIIMMAKSQELIAASDVFSLLSVDERQARRYLNRLVDLGFLEAEGVTKNKKYRYKRGARE